MRSWISGVTASSLLAVDVDSPAARDVRQQSAGQLLDRQLADVAAVEMIQFLVVPDGRRGVDALQAEALDQLLAAHDLGLVVEAPAEQRQVVDHGFRQIARLLERAHEDRQQPAVRRPLLALAHLALAAWG